MTTFRIALANIQFPATPEESVTLAEQAIAQASTERADLICFPECCIPGYRLAADPANSFIPREGGLVSRRREHLFISLRPLAFSRRWKSSVGLMDVRD